MDNDDEFKKFRTSADTEEHEIEEKSNDPSSITSPLSQKLIDVTKLAIPAVFCTLFTFM